MHIPPPRTLFALLAHAHLLLSLSNGEARNASGAHAARTFHGPLRESGRGRDRALSLGYATGATLADVAAHARGEEMRRHVRPEFASVEEPPAGAHRGPARHHGKKIKLNAGLSTGTPAGGFYNAAKPHSMGEAGGSEEGDGLKRATKEEAKKAARRGRTRPNKSLLVSAQSWEPIPKPVALTSTDMPFDLFTRREEFFTFREENPWDATPMTPPSSQDFVEEIKNPFYPVTSETYGAYAITCVSGVIFLVGIAGNIAILCIVCQNYYMKSISNSLLANLAVWDFVLILFCLPMVVFHELTKSWLLGEFTCKVVPYLEVNWPLLLHFYFFFFKLFSVHFECLVTSSAA